MVLDQTRPLPQPARTVYTGTVELNLHITTTNNPRALECGCEGNRYRSCNFNLNILALNRSGSVELGYVPERDQALRHTEMFSALVGDYRKPSAIAPAPSYDNIIQRLERIYERRYTVHGVLHQRAPASPALRWPKIRAARSATDTTWITAVTSC